MLMGCCRRVAGMLQRQCRGAAEVQRFIGSEVQRFRGLEVLRFKGSEVQRDRCRYYGGGGPDMLNMLSFSFSRFECACECAVRFRAGEKVKMKRCRVRCRGAAEGVLRRCKGPQEVLQRFRGPEIQGFKGLKGQVQILRC